MDYGKFTWEDVVIGIIFAVMIVTWTAGTIKGWW
jgi:hypothetical protein